ncbi:MAG TPA: heavy metal-responsive transcriptional regulator [Acidimicrobiales bacterium]|jgi:DNA-binding transcriptional MerR regulator|nr:heavy metal-responsive transcriptional regulator [Acidimicrobiales bacterium]
MRIGELSDLAGVPTKTIRFYEELGLLPPADRTPSGYRDFGPDAGERLAFIRAAQAVGLTLGEIRSVVGLRDRGETPCEHVLDLIEARAADVDRRITELEALRTELHRLARRAKRLDPAECEPGRVCHLIGD